MRITLSLVSLVAAAWLAACMEQPESASPGVRVFHNAVVYTVHPDRPQAQALAVSDGRLLAVGSDEDVLAAYPDAETVDLQGRTVVPGLIDAHAHLMGLGESRLQADLVGAESVEEVVERLRAFEAEAELPEGAWLTGRGWDQNDWPVQEFPSREDLDEAFPDRPVWLRRIDGHAAWANTAAHRVVGEERLRALPDPEGGRIVRDARGEPTGIFIDSAMEYVGGHEPPLTEAQLDRALRLAVDEVKRYGLTGVHDAGAGLDEIARYRRAADAGDLDVRVYAMVGGRGEAFDYYCREGMLLDYADRLTIRSVKFYVDGALGSRGAALLEPYTDDPGNTGLLRIDADAFTRHVREAVACGYQVNTHAIGDAGNRLVIEAYEQAADPEGRHRIEHLQVLALEDLPRLQAAGIIASMQPTHATSDMYWAEERLGPRRVHGAYAWRSVLDSGARLALGSDFPVEHVNPLLGFYAAVARRDAEGYPEDGWYPEEALTREEALRGFTLDAAYAAFQENDLGSLEPGKRADFVVLSRDIMTAPIEEVLDTEVLATYLGGTAVFEAE